MILSMPQDDDSKIRRFPHLAGPAICLHCRHHWAAVAPVGANNFDCPECGLTKGVWQAIHGVPDGEPAFECTVNDCGNDIFKVSREYILCCKCGHTHWQPLE